MNCVRIKRKNVGKSFLLTRGVWEFYVKSKPTVGTSSSSGLILGPKAGITFIGIMDTVGGHSIAPKTPSANAASASP